MVTFQTGKTLRLKILSIFFSLVSHFHTECHTGSMARLMGLDRYI